MSKPKQTLCAIGLMSGTSMDGVDAALLYACLGESGAEIVSLGAHLEIAFDAELRDEIAAVLGAEEPSGQTRDVEKKLGVYYALAVEKLLQKAELSAKDVDVIGLHGQTITHRPEKPFTWQLGDGAELARQTGIAVVYDFRQNDLRHGGQGAPLAPVFHQALARDGFLPSLPLVVVNIGGVSNITLLTENSIRAYDSGPGNGPMDDYAQEVLGLAFDQDGAIALSGQADSGIVANFLSHPYFVQDAPKSLDRRDFDHRGVLHLSPPNALRTLCACSAVAIAYAIEEECQQVPELKRLLLAGGGRYNQALSLELKNALLDMEVLMIDELPAELSGDALEAWAFAWLAVLNRGDIPASFPSTTGVKTPQRAGVFIAS